MLNSTFPQFPSLIRSGLSFFLYIYVHPPSCYLIWHDGARQLRTMLFMAEILIKHCAFKMLQMFTLINMNIIRLSIVRPELGISKAGQENSVFVRTCSIYKGH